MKSARTFPLKLNWHFKDSSEAGYFRMLACASIPNTQIDLAGITCGHSLMPFWMFFGAILIEKARIKMHIWKNLCYDNLQLAHSGEDDGFHQCHIRHRSLSAEAIPGIPWVWAAGASPQQQSGMPQGENSLSWVFEWVVVMMGCYFILPLTPLHKIMPNEFSSSWTQRKKN